MLRATTLTIATLLTMLAAPVPASAEGAVSCSGGWGFVGCTWRNGTGKTHVRAVPQPKSEQDKAESAHRERLWVARCRPRLTVDDLGMQRYAYAASACDLGKYQ